jgi:hypothetical protein
MTLESFRTTVADVWIAFHDSPSYQYCYGGTRQVPPDASDEEAEAELKRLAGEESGVKNALLNTGLQRGAVDAQKDRLPPDFPSSRVGGGRCIIRPRSSAVADILRDPGAPGFVHCIDQVFQPLGDVLNHLGGRLKLTPDFGRYSPLADLLYRHTPHVMGIRCQDGGSGGKSSYSASGICAALETLRAFEDQKRPLTLIGSAGAMGSGVLSYCLQQGIQDLAVSDVVYQYGSGLRLPPPGVQVLPSRFGMFTEECLRRGGIIVATTVGHELQNSNIRAMAPGTTILLAHNLAIPAGQEGLLLMDNIADSGVLALPGQGLTCGGALTCRLEWFWRQSNPGMEFDKPLAHLVVKTVVAFLTRQVLALSEATGMTPYRAMLDYCRPNTELALR